MKEFSIADLDAALKKKEFSSVELTKFFLKRIRKYNHDLNAVITICDEAALIEAKKADMRIAGGNAPDLCGIPILHKISFALKMF